MLPLGIVSVAFSVIGPIAMLLLLLGNVVFVLIVLGFVMIDFSAVILPSASIVIALDRLAPVSYTHLRAHET